MNRLLVTPHRFWLTAVGRGEGAKGSEKARVVIKLGAWHTGGFHVLEYLWVGSTSETKQFHRRQPKIANEGSLFFDPSIEGERAREPRGAHP